jgi:hypothetical protein
MGDRNKNFEDPITWTQDLRKTKFDLLVGKKYLTYPNWQMAIGARC